MTTATSSAAAPAGQADQAYAAGAARREVPTDGAARAASLIADLL